MDKPDNTNRLSLAEEQSIYRILDASANRCREGLRVIEEYVRFHQEDEKNVKKVKTVRHQFSQVCLELDLEQALHARDTPGDVGTRISLPTEISRQSLKDLVRANCSRVGESLRTLEEYSKLIATKISPEIEKIRYLFYDIEKQLLADNSLQKRLEKSSLYYLITAGQGDNTAASGESFEKLAQQAILAGVDIIQLREKYLPDRELLKRAKLLRKWTKETETLFIINDRPDIAILCDADGVHVGQEELPIKEVRKIIGKEKLVGVSTHNLQQATRAVEQGANYLGVGPVYPSQTKKFQQLAGLELLKQIRAEIQIPWFAIGGINCSNIHGITEVGAKRIAVSHALSTSDNLIDTVTIFKKTLRKAGTFSDSNTSQ